MTETTDNQATNISDTPRRDVPDGEGNETLEPAVEMYQSPLEQTDSTDGDEQTNDEQADFDFLRPFSRPESFF